MKRVRIFIGLICCILSGSNFAQIDTLKVEMDSTLTDTIVPIIYTFTEPPFTLTSDFYKARYKEEDLMTKVTDNFGNGFDSLYGTRNLRPILHGVAYRGGANNYFHKTAKRKNSNPLPEDGIKALCQEGFSNSVYLYRTNFDTLRPVDSCACVNNTVNKMQYSQYDYFDDAHIYEMLKMVYESAKDSTKGPVYLHCWNGWHASGFISALILKQFCGYSDLEAVSYWDLGTDGANTSPRYRKIRDDIKAFKPYSEFLITDSLENRICPPMPQFIDSSQLHLTIEHLVIVPEAIPLGTTLILENIQFGPNKTSFYNASNNNDVQQILKALEKSKDVSLEIGGHTDRSGKEHVNKQLSTERAKFVYDVLIKNGVDANRLTYKGYGSAKPAYTNRTSEGRAANRRIEVKIIGKAVESDKLVDEEPVVIKLEEEKNYKLSELPQLDSTKRIVMKAVVFEPSMFHINDTNRHQIDSLVIILNENPNINIAILGHTDRSGIEEKNVILSENRAKSVYDYLILKGIAAERLTYKGYGSAKPIATNKYRWGRDLNRRIEIKRTQ